MRLIDADALYLGKFVEPRTEWHQGWNDALDAATTQAQTIDAVEVVKCKDCKHCDFREFRETVCWRRNNVVCKEDFCSYGERKEADGNG